VVDSGAQLFGVSIVDTLAQPAGDQFGDGVVVWSNVVDATAELSRSYIGGSARAGLSVFGAAASIHATTLSCNTFHLASESHAGRSGMLTDAGDNRCVCGEEEQTCSALSVGLEPPAEPHIPGD
jgi:hypothetical protein